MKCICLAPTPIPRTTISSSKYFLEVFYGQVLTGRKLQPRDVRSFWNTSLNPDCQQEAPVRPLQTNTCSRLRFSVGSWLLVFSQSFFMATLTYSSFYKEFQKQPSHPTSLTYFLFYVLFQSNEKESKSSFSVFVVSFCIRTLKNMIVP